MTVETDLLRAILADPDDDDVRLVYADWLEEQGDPDLAEHLRLECQIAALPDPDWDDPEYQALRQRRDRLLNKHKKRWIGDKPRGWSVDLHKGTLSVRVKGNGIFRLTESDWWESNKLRVASLRIENCRDDVLQFALGHAPHVNSLWLPEHRFTPDGLRGVDAMPNLHSLTLIDGSVNDACLELFRPLTKLTYLYIFPHDHNDVTDSGFAAVAGMKQLRQLQLNHTSVTGAGFDILGGFPLTLLVLGHSPVHDGGLQPLGRMTGLRELHLYDLHITEAGVQSLAGLTGLKKLVIYGDNLTDAGLTWLPNLADLRELSLKSSGLTGAVVGFLTGLPEVRNLALWDFPLDDAAVDRLAGMNRLRMLFLPDGHRLPPGAVQRLRAALPGCSVYGGN